MIIFYLNGTIVLVLPNEEVILYSLLNGKITLKIDTIKSAKIASYYRDADKYTIIHIPNFQTIERILDEKENTSNNVKPVIYNAITNTDYLPNYIVENPKNLSVKWGNLEATSENYSLKEFHQNIATAPQLFYGKEELNYSKLRITVIGEKKVYTKPFSKSDFGTKEMENLFKKIETKTSIYLDKIEIIDNGVNKHLQHRFLFKIGNDVIGKNQKSKLQNLLFPPNPSLKNKKLKRIAAKLNFYIIILNLIVIKLSYLKNVLRN